MTDTVLILDLIALACGMVAVYLAIWEKDEDDDV